MMIQLLTSDPGRYFAIILVVVVSIVLHELAHGIVAVRLGDRTPIETGHMTLNPLVHMGAFSLILLAVAGFAFGQMPVNRSRLRGKYGDVWVSLAGPMMNLLLGVVGVVGLALVFRFSNLGEEGQVARNAILLLQTLATTNFALMLLNLVPIPPLDGSYVLAGLVPAYRDLLSSETARGFTSAALFAVFLGGGRYLFAAAEYATLYGVVWITRLTH